MFLRFVFFANILLSLTACAKIFVQPQDIQIATQVPMEPVCLSQTISQELVDTCLLKGITMDQVKAVLGESGTQQYVAGNEATYTWGKLVVTFADDKLQKAVLKP